MTVLVHAVGFGIAAGAVISLGAVGFTVQFAISNVFNLAYGAFMTLAAYIGYTLVQRGVNVWLALVLTGIAIAVVAVLYNRTFLTPLQRRGGGFVQVAIGTVMVAIIIQYVLTIVAGPFGHTYGPQYDTTVSVLGFVFTAAQLIIIGATLLLMLTLHLLLTRTKLGRAMRATSTNITIARACGIRTARIVDLTWLITGFLCGAAGVALAMTTVTFDSNTGQSFAIYVIAAAVLGGIGQPYGAMLGGLSVGIVSQVAAAYWNPSYQDVAAFGILVVMLLVKPQGLFASPGAGRRGLASSAGS